MPKQFNTRVIQKHDTISNWAKATNFIPKSGEVVVYQEDDYATASAAKPTQFKVGDGIHTVSALPFSTYAVSQNDITAQIDALSGVNVSCSATEYVSAVSQTKGRVSASKTSFPIASATQAGFISIDEQTFAGKKTFSGDVFISNSSLPGLYFQSPKDTKPVGNIYFHNVTQAGDNTGVNTALIGIKGVSSDSTSLSEYTTYFKFAGNKALTTDVWYDVLHSGNYTTYVPTKTGVGASGTWNITSAKVTIADTAPSATQTRYRFVTSAGTGSQSLLAISGISYQTKNGTTSAEGEASIILGNSTAKGTADNLTGGLFLFNAKGQYTNLLGNFELASDNPVVQLPLKSGTLALTTDYSWNQKQEYNYRWGGMQDLAWRTVVKIVGPTTAPSSSTYQGVSVKGIIYDETNNYDCTQVLEYPFQLHIKLVNGTSIADDAALRLAAGCDSKVKIRAVKVSTNSYELQIKQVAEYRKNRIRFTIDGALNYVTVYNPSDAQPASSGIVLTNLPLDSNSTYFLENLDGSFNIQPNSNGTGINFGGTNASSWIYFGQNSAGSRPIPTAFVFGQNGAASLVGSKVIFDNGTGAKYIDDSNYTGNAATATKLATARAITVGNTSVQFDGNTDVSISSPLKHAEYGSDVADTAGWYKVGTWPIAVINSDLNLVLQVTSGYSTIATGILYLHVRRGADTALNLKALTWLVRYGFKQDDFYWKNNDDTTFSLYVYQANAQWGRIGIDILSEYGTMHKTDIALQSNETVEPSTPTGGVASTDGGIVNYANSAGSIAWGNVSSKPSYYDAKAIKTITRSGTTFTYTCLDGTTGTFTQQDNDTTYTALKNPYALTLSLNGASQGTYDGSAAITYDIPVASETKVGLVNTGTQVFAGDKHFKGGLYINNASDPIIYFKCKEDTNSVSTIYGTSYLQNSVIGGNRLTISLRSSKSDKTGYTDYKEYYYIESDNDQTADKWYHILTSKNYTIFAPTKTGGGASGIWNISITGNAATAKESSSEANVITNEVLRNIKATQESVVAGTTSLTTGTILVRYV